MDSFLNESLNKHIENLLIEGNLQEALKILLLKTNDSEKILSPIREEIILMSARLSDVINDFRSGLIDYEVYLSIKYRITSGVLHTIKKDKFIENVIDLDVIDEKSVIIPNDDSKCKIIPLIPKNITASITHNFDEIEKLKFEYISIPQNSYHRELYAFKIKGNSMNPIKEGMIVVVNPIYRLHQIKSGERFVIVTNEEAMFKRVLEYDENSFLLVSDNPDYRKQIIDKRDLNMLFQCVDIFKEEDIRYTNKRGNVSNLWNELQTYRFSK